MAGYNYVATKTGKLSVKEPSPIIFFETFKRTAIELFDSTVTNKKKAGYKLGEVSEYELPSFEACGDARQIMKECSGTDKEGNPVTFRLERFHVGGQAAERGIGSKGKGK